MKERERAKSPLTLEVASKKYFIKSSITFGPNAPKHSKALSLNSSSSSSLISSVRIGTAYF